jgi:DNA-binding beta-propeller fold protein YncE
MKRSIINDTKQNKKQKLSMKCEIIDTIDIARSRSIITPCGKFLIYIEKHSICKYCLETKQKFRIAGSVNKLYGHQNGPRDESRFNLPQGLTLSKDLKTLFVSDTCNRVIRAICIVTGVTTTFVGQVKIRNFVDGPKEKACFKYPTPLKLSPDGNTLYVADGYKLRTICTTTGQVNTIHTIYKFIRDFTLSPDSKHVIICHSNQVLKIHLETGKSEFILKGQGFYGCDISKDGILVISNYLDKEIHFVNIVTNKVIDTIETPFEPRNIIITTNDKQLYVSCYNVNKIQVLDISKYCTNFKTFLQSQLSKHSFLSQAVVKRMSI